MSEETTEHNRKMPAGVRAGMIKVSGKEYLPVPFRLVWMRDEKPLWGISTEVIEAAGYAMVRATVTDETGRVIASAHKALTAGGKFPPVEKAETGAMGRALGAAGFGTQFGELDEEEPGVMGGIADSPVNRGGNRAWTNQPQQRHNEQAYGVRPPNVDASGEVHDGIPSRPPLSTKQQEEMLQKAMAEFRETIGKFDAYYRHTQNFTGDDMYAWVAALTENKTPTVGDWKNAVSILQRFQQAHPVATADVIESAMKVRFNCPDSMQLPDYTEGMWAQVFAQEPANVG